jgi:hypothetical protein
LRPLTACLSFTLYPQKNYYHELFSIADQNKTGEIHGQAAVSFLSRSKLPVDLLRNIWTMVDHPKTNSLNRSKFFTAVRLIQLFQNGQKVTGPGLQSVGNIMRPPFFEGITGVSATPFEIVEGGIAPAASSPASPRRDSQLSYNVPPTSSVPQQEYPIKPATSEANTALTHDPYLMLPGERIRYESLFPQYAQDDFVYGAQAVELFTKSGLSKEVLRDIWNLVDNPVDNRLDILEFAIAMHLIVCVSKKNLPLPKTLPFSLKALKDREGANVQHQQQPLNAISPPRMSPQGPALQPNYASPVPATAAAAVAMHHVRTASQGTFTGVQPSFSYGSVSVPTTTTAATTTTIPMGGAAIGNISEAFDGLGIKTQAQQGIGSQEQNHPSLPSPTRSPHNHQLHAIGNATTAYTADRSIEQNSATNGSHSSSKEELEKVKAVLQKLQAENVSLKAQLGQYSEEEKSIRDEIAKTVSEIDTLSHDLTLLRSQVVEAKGSLIEASAELKAQVEKRE